MGALWLSEVWKSLPLFSGLSLETLNDPHVPDGQDKEELPIQNANSIPFEE